MRTDEIIYAGDLRIEGWHHYNRMVLDPSGLSTCLVAQSNNSLQEVIEYEDAGLRERE